MTSIDPRYVAARRALLDALFALRGHADSLVIAGAQAVYLHTGDGDLAIAPFTTDADLALNPQGLSPDPLIEAAMKEAGFALALYDGHVEPGIWVTKLTVDDEEIDVPVDLIVPQAATTGGGRRGARLGVHGKQAARLITGLEACLVDHAPMPITALEPDDDRRTTAEVAGPAALLVAKAHKLHDRLTSPRPDRLKDKDAADVLRLMQTTDPAKVGTKMNQLVADEMAGDVTAAALGYLKTFFGRRGAPGIEMAVRATRLAIPEERVQAICLAYSSALSTATS
ncbi:hypothetical protein NBH00_21470 [Paraconexibacter antarcticus]|uniref:Nucleotidyltransferase n=1 Tax=Paraconexibacter antarcticus TaxID=2949664 RepID=A0ABY5DSH3_9ACTN|nr:hypothetical protein [Paraconexibacter antarcticus]UTI63901.1 hypothetical protein NBH00_21470 [Paraconexibacter antarcticus]